MTTIHDIFEEALTASMQVALEVLQAAHGIASDHQRLKELGDDAVRYKITCWWQTDRDVPSRKISFTTRSTMPLAEAIQRAEAKYYKEIKAGSNQLEVVVIIGQSSLTLTNEQLSRLMPDDG